MACLLSPAVTHQQCLFEANRRSGSSARGSLAGLVQVIDDPGNPQQRSVWCLGISWALHRSACMTSALRTDSAARDAQRGPTTVNSRAGRTARTGTL